MSRINQSVFLLISLFFILTSSDTYSQQDSARGYTIINRIIITGNKVTKPHIITRELIFHENDTLPDYIYENAIKRSKENLMNTGLFNFVEINNYKDNNNKTDIQINLTERWYLWPFPFFEVVDRNFNEWWLTRDLSRTNYGIYLTRENFRGRDESLKMQVRLGYSQRLGIFYSIPYINKKQDVGVSFGAYYNRNHEVTFRTLDNKLQFYKDPEKYIRQDWSFSGRVSKREGIYDYYSITADYRRVDVEDTVITLNNDYFIREDNMQQQISIAWSYRHDKRDYQPYPLKGYLFDLEVAKTGFGFLKNEPEILAIYSSYRKYFKWSNKLYSSVAIRGKLSGQSETPYVNMRALGYGSDLVRGYEYYVVNGNNFFLIKSTLLKFNLLPTRIYNIPYIRSEKFGKIPNTIYVSLSADAGYVRDRQFGATNFLSNKWLSGYGVGFDYITYYDLVFRFEYSFNDLGEHGFFLNFAAPF